MSANFPTAKTREAAERFAERREREEAAPRLRDRVPALESLALTIRHENDGRRCPGSEYVRRVSVATGPALIWIPCAQAHCLDGGHDITGAVLRALGMKLTEFDGDDGCRGRIGNEDCHTAVFYTAVASYLPG